MVWVGMDLGDHQVPTLAMGRDVIHWIRLVRAPSNLGWMSYQDTGRIPPLIMLQLFLIFSLHSDITDLAENYQEGTTVIQRVPKILSMPM